MVDARNGCSLPCLKDLTSIETLKRLNQETVSEETTSTFHTSGERARGQARARVRVTIATEEQSFD